MGKKHKNSKKTKSKPISENKDSKPMAVIMNHNDKNGIENHGLELSGIHDDASLSENIQNSNSPYDNQLNSTMTDVELGQNDSINNDVMVPSKSLIVSCLSNTQFNNSGLIRNISMQKFKSDTMFNFYHKELKIILYLF